MNRPIIVDYLQKIGIRIALGSREKLSVEWPNKFLRERTEDFLTKHKRTLLDFLVRETLSKKGTDHQDVSVDEVEVTTMIFQSTTAESICASLYGRLEPVLAIGQPDTPPEIDDMTARCINRAGGWAKIIEANYLNLSEVKVVFGNLFRELWWYKVTGFYERDKLPILTEVNNSVSSYRLARPSFLSVETGEK